MLAIPGSCFREMIRECPVVTRSSCTRWSIARVSSRRRPRDEKLISLGKLAAGLAHELNNPASAVVRSAALLAEASPPPRTRRAPRRRATDRAQFAAIDTRARRCACRHRRRAGTRSSAPTARKTHRRLAHRPGATEEWPLPLADTGVTPAALDMLAASVSGRRSTRRSAGSRLVHGAHAGVGDRDGVVAHPRSRGRVKGFSYMDHAPTPEPVDIRRGITDTLTMLRQKTRAKSVR